jgi:hypothetical protein
VAGRVGVVTAWKPGAACSKPGWLLLPASGSDC